METTTFGGEGMQSFLRAASVFRTAHSLSNASASHARGKELQCRWKSKHQARGGKGKRRYLVDEEGDGLHIGKLERSLGMRMDRKRAHDSGMTIIEGEKDIREGEEFDAATLASQLDTIVDRLRQDLKPITGQINASLPTSVVENLMLDHPQHGRVPITSLAAVSMEQGGGLKVSIFDAKEVAVVEGFLRSKSLAASRSGSQVNSLHVKPTRFSPEARQNLLKRATEIISQSAAKIERTRNNMHNALKRDIKNKIVNDRESRQENKEMDDVTRQRMNEINNIRKNCRRVVLDE